MTVSMAANPYTKRHSEQQPCAECRKRRLKCSKTLPCQNCVSHGRTTACIQGSIVKGTRSLKPSAVALHEDMTVMSKRQYALEQALAELQASISSEPHPLLVTDSQIRTASPVPGLLSGGEIGNNEDQNQAADATDELVEGLGMMSIRNDGSTPYHGDTATSEFLLKESDETEEPANDPPAKRRPPPLRVSPALVLLSALFPCPPVDNEPLDMDVFLDFLPPYDRAHTLLHYYFSYFSWCTMLVTRTETIEGIFKPLYPGGVKTESLRHSDAHRLAVLFLMFLLGTLYDLDLDIARVTIEAEEFHSLARAAMTAVPVVDHPTVQGVQALVLMIWYFRLFPGRRPPSYQWALSGILTRVVQAVGLHRDRSAFIKEPTDRLFYEQTFWEYNSVDIWQSFMFGRPTSMVSSMIDCKWPFTVDVPCGHDPEFFRWKYSFTQLVSDVNALRATTYADVLHCDKRLKDHYTPDSLVWPSRSTPLSRDEAVGKTFQRYIMTVWKNVSIMYIHRRWMFHAFKEHKDDPSKSPYWPSVAAAYDSATALVDDTRRIWLTYTELIERMAPFWSHAHSAALVLCALVMHIPDCDFADDALRHLDQTYQMFEDAKESLQPSNALPSLRKCQRLAHHAYNKFHNSAEHAENGVRRHEPSVSISPSDTQFPFTFGDSPSPHIAGPSDQTMYDGSNGFKASSSPSSNTMIPVYPVLPPSHTQRRPSVLTSRSAYGGAPIKYEERQHTIGQGHLMPQMGVHY